ncbi:MAG TPA: family 1 encapsulin nanocompartment shell protein [Solirubrobacterales bacterium]|nr:family 1 encapsulin nanocompartment shell protein [Solirubrobacterales bacterium]
MDILRRDSARLSERVWQAMDEAVAQAARHVMAARRIATFDGPKGWDYFAAPLGTMASCQTREGQATVCIPDVALLAEIRSEFTLPWAAVEAFERGGPTLDTAAAEAAAREVALAEDRLALFGDPAGSGFLTSKESRRLSLADWKQPEAVLTDLLRAVETLDKLGIPGPYEALLAPVRYYAYLRAAEEGGYPIARHLKDVLAGVHRSQVLSDGGGLFATRGGDFVLTVGGDLAAGYRSHDREALHLFCVETVAAQTLTPQAVCVLEAPGR